MKMSSSNENHPSAAPSHLSEVLLAISQCLANGADLTTILQQIVEGAVALIPHADRAVFHVFDECEQILRPLSVAGADEERTTHSLELRPGIGIAGTVLLSGETILVPDVHLDSRFLLASRKNDRIASLLVTPVMADDRKLGTLSVHSKQRGAFAPTDQHLLTLLGRQAALAFERSRRFDVTERCLADVNALYQVTQGVIEAEDEDTLLQRVVDALTEHCGYDYVLIYLADRATGELIMQQGSSEVGERLKRMGHRVIAGKGIVGRVAAEGRPFYTNCTRETPFFVETPLLAGIGAELAVPLHRGDQVLGVIDLQLRPPKTFGDQDVQLVAAVASQMVLALEKMTLAADLQAALYQERAARAQLVQSEKLAALGRIVASVAHELNNPLQAIQNALYLLKVSETISPQSLEDVQAALEEANRMADIIARLRETYRPTASEDFRLDSLNLIIHEVERLISAHLSSHHITYRFDEDPNLPLVPMVRDQIKQVVLNICLNAVEAMENGGKLTVRTRFVSRKSRVSFSVTDSGGGIPSDILPHIFDPFVTTKTTGTGLGLAITDDIIRRHRGKIDVESVEGKGTTFTVWLPLEHL